MESIPWARLMTSYGTAAELPSLFAALDAQSFKRIGDLIEHQGSFWQATPWAVQWLVEHHANYHDQQYIYRLFAMLSHVLYWRMERPGIPRLRNQRMLLNEARFMPEKCSPEELEVFLEDYEISDAEYGSYYYYTLQQMRRLIPEAQKYLRSKNDCHAAAREFFDAINPRVFSVTSIFYPENKGGRMTLPDLLSGRYMPHLKLEGNEIAYGVIMYAEENPQFDQGLSVKITCLYRDSLDYTPLLDTQEGLLYEGPKCVGKVYFEPIFFTSADDIDI